MRKFKLPASFTDPKRQVFFKLDEDVYDRLKIILPHGQKSALLRKYCADLADILGAAKEKGEMNFVLGAILSGKIGLGYNKLEKEEEHVEPN